MIKIWHDPVDGSAIQVGSVQTQPHGVVVQVKTGDKAGRLFFIEQAIWERLAVAADNACDCGAASVKDMTHAPWCNLRK